MKGVEAPRSALSATAVVESNSVGLPVRPRNLLAVMALLQTAGARRLLRLRSRC
jgi:hypothetical protein